MCIRIRHPSASAAAAAAAALPTMYGALNAGREGDWSVGRSMGHAIFCHFPAAAVPRSPVEIAMILSSGIIGIHLQDEAVERGRERERERESECTYSKVLPGCNTRFDLRLLDNVPRGTIRQSSSKTAWCMVRSSSFRRRRMSPCTLVAGLMVWANERLCNNAVG